MCYLPAFHTKETESKAHSKGKNYVPHLISAQFFCWCCKKTLQIVFFFFFLLYDLNPDCILFQIDIFWRNHSESFMNSVCCQVCHGVFWHQWKYSIKESHSLLTKSNTFCRQGLMKDAGYKAYWIKTLHIAGKRATARHLTEV